MKGLSWIQIIGGIVGFIFFTLRILKGNLGMIVGLPFFTFSIITGILMLKKHKLCIKLTLINFFLQLIKIKAFGVIYSYYVGLAFFLNLSSNYVGFNFKYGAGFIVGTNGSNISMFSINIFALVILGIIFYYLKKYSNTVSKVKYCNL